MDLEEPSDRRKTDCSGQAMRDVVVTEELEVVWLHGQGRVLNQALIVYCVIQITRQLRPVFFFKSSDLPSHICPHCRLDMPTVSQIWYHPLRDNTIKIMQIF